MIGDENLMKNQGDLCSINLKINAIHRNKYCSAS